MENLENRTGGESKSANDVKDKDARVYFQEQYILCEKRATDRVRKRLLRGARYRGRF